MQVNKPASNNLQAGIRARAARKLVGSQIIKVKPTPIPSRPRRVVSRVAGDAAATLPSLLARNCAAKIGADVRGSNCRVSMEELAFPVKPTSSST